MPKTKEYDDQLVELLGTGELSIRQIAKRLGMSFSQVSRIARGEARLDLQPRINAAMRRTLKEAWKNGGRLATESGKPLPRTGAHAPFDRYLAVELIASGQHTLTQIADRLGISRSAAGRIATGRTHPEFQPLIREAERHYRDRARRLGSKWSVQIVTKQIKVGLEDNGWVGLRARQDLLDRFLSPEDDSASQPPAPESRPFSSDLEKLPRPLQDKVIKALGGPGGEDDPYGDAHWPSPAAEQELLKDDVAQPPSAEQKQRTPQPGAAALQAGMRRTPRAPPVGSQ